MGTIHVVGLGPGSIEHLTLGVYKLLKQANLVYVRTFKHPLIDDLIEEGIVLEGFDWIYETSKDFETVYEEIAKLLLQKANIEDQIIFAVPGHPLFAEKTVEILIEILDNGQDKVKMQIHSSMSFLDVVVTSLKIDPINGLNIMNALTIEKNPPNLKVGNIITQVYDRFVASEVKLSLLEFYDGDKEIFLLSSSGIKGKERLERIPLYKLDHMDGIDYLTTIYIPPEKEDKLSDINRLLDIMSKLRSKDGCPWDKEQTHDSLKRYLIEEVYEVIHAIDNKDNENIIEELGDLLLQIIFHCQIAKENGIFELKDVVEGINKKLIYRHPHVFDKFHVSYSDKRWEELKKREKGHKFQYEAMEDVPKSMPTLYLAEKIQKKAANVGFDWGNPLPSIDKIVEESLELKESINTLSLSETTNELGDLLFSVVNVARLCQIDPDEALHKTIEKFICRFKFIEERLNESGIQLAKADLDTMNMLWDKAKEEIG
ncbi:nucleoside triphosphate pyrophosphohydrolase [Alkalibaculum sp. M08DMB]|uniref:Nucleoside triphosphate pyrophosphohydrolase n=1 Tax=Alkalibaculum sporogenes TaxID=2655001 RepID=A0A6A7K710_9FIRM|nr:nucleoside triphosphate pyrophosphohydrolase [Alkalibaculum sporogenes]MPW24967.1 nucleoside triphosphate pyrophosphohydrolase [Alkalibaculum sporogenes]